MVYFNQIYISRPTHMDKVVKYKIVYKCLPADQVNFVKLNDDFIE